MIRPDDIPDDADLDPDEPIRLPVYVFAIALAAGVLWLYL